MTATDRKPGLAEIVSRRRDLGDGPPGFLDMIASLREFQDRLAEAAPPADLIADVRAQLDALSARLAGHAVPEEDQPVGNLFSVAGRGQALVPAVHVDEVLTEPLPELRGRVTFGPYLLGANGAVHGGVIPLVFDDVLGWMAHSAGRVVSRTAYLHVDYRSITPIGRELQVRAWFDRIEGRKRYLLGTLHDGDTLCAEVSGLFVELRPGQP